MTQCSNKRRSAGLAYPRTCSVCGLGPCRETSALNPPDPPTNTVKHTPDAREWQPISEAPTLERVIVAGWQPRRGTTSGYWWFHEDCTDDKGVPMDHPNASHFVVLASVLPVFPAPQEKRRG